MSLEQLKKIRSRRMDQCVIELQEQRRILAEQEATLRARQQQLVEFGRWRLQYQESLFAKLQDQPFTPQALLDYQKVLQQLSQEEQRLREQLGAAEQALQTAYTQVQAAQQNSKVANLKLEKIKEIIKTQVAQTNHEEPAQ
ncbi:MAG: type III secretion system stalk subunit SctO [Thiothrix sp.]